MNINFINRVSIFGLILFGLASCSIIFVESNASRSALRDSLNDKGQVRLDPSNPYIAPNAFLAEEAKHSEILKGFLSMKGNPTALSFEDGFFSKSKLTLYYEDKAEAYSLVQAGDDWIIGAPYPIEGKNLEGQKTSSSLYREEAPLVTYLDPKLEEAKNNATKEKVEEKKVEETSSDSNEFPDIYHYVRSTDESLEFISYWYTGTGENVDRISRINNVRAFNKLKIGQSIRIPSYLVKKSEAPSEDDLKTYLIEHQ